MCIRDSYISNLCHVGLDVFQNKNMVMCINFICEIISRIVKVGVIVFPGSNCDRDMFLVLTDVFHLDTQYFWHQTGLPTNIDAVILPGGFSYGDRLRAGVIAANSPIINDVKKLADKGIPILGVCNGFQILVESNLLHGVLLKNDSLNFMCEWTNLIVKNNKTPFTNKLELDQRIPIPIAVSYTHLTLPTILLV